jgi:hypothetical protein
MSQHSVTLATGASKTLFSKNIQNYVKLNLTAPAKELLDSRPDKFLELYGTHYVSEVVYGASFLGLYNVYSSEQSSTDSISVLA